MVEEALAEAGHAVLGPVASVDAALALVEPEMPELALVDINLDGQMDGVDLARKLSAANVTVLFATGQIDMARAARAHASGVIGKPFRPELLVSVVNAIERDSPYGRVDGFPDGVEMFAPRRRRR